MPSKRPSFQFYPGDWIRDSVAGCSLAAQGLWLRMMIVAHDCDPYGYLGQNGTPMPPDSIARRCGCESVEQYSQLLSELREAGVPSRTDNGVIFSRRMVRDESLREVRASGGSESLNNPKVAQPKSKGGEKDTGKDTYKDGSKDEAKDGSETVSDEPAQPSLGVSPSSSSSPSSSNNKVKTFSGAPSKSDDASQKVPLITLTLNDQSEYPIIQAQLNDWQGLYPAVDVAQELRNMRGWCITHPQNRKTRSGILRFVNGWLQKAQNQAPTRQPMFSPATLPAPAPEWKFPPNLDKEAGDALWTATLRKLEGRINRHSYETWLKPTRAEGLGNGTLFVAVPVREFCYIGDKFKNDLSELLPDVKVEFVAPSEVSHT